MVHFSGISDLFGLDSTIARHGATKMPSMRTKKLRVGINILRQNLLYDRERERERERERPCEV